MVQLSISYMQLWAGFNAATGFLMLSEVDEEWFWCSIIMSRPDMWLLPWL